MVYGFLVALREVTKETVFFFVVDDRSRATLLPIIKQYIRPGTEIISDKWKAYDTLSSEGYTHKTVNHSKTFVDPDTGACTNTIESTWHVLKSFRLRRGYAKTLMASYFAEFIFRRKFLNNSEDPFHDFIRIGVNHTYNKTKAVANLRLKQASRPLKRKAHSPRSSSPIPKITVTFEQTLPTPLAEEQFTPHCIPGGHAHKNSLWNTFNPFETEANIELHDRIPPTPFLDIEDSEDSADAFLSAIELPGLIEETVETEQPTIENQQPIIIINSSDSSQSNLPGVDDTPSFNLLHSFDSSSSDLPNLD